MKTNIEANKRKNDFYGQLVLSESTTRHYRQALKGVFLQDILEKECHTSDIFELTNLDDLWRIYSLVNLHPVNIRVHRAYSSAIMKYIRFLNNGKKYGNRIDFQKSRKKKKE